MLRTLLIAAATFGIAASAQAADLAGPYVGGAVTHDSFGGSGSLEGLGLSGAGGSVFAGYNVPLASGFVGIEGNVDLNTADAEGVEAKWGYGIGGRAGLNLSDSTAAYVRAGYQRTKAEANDVSDWGDGVRFGGGIETAIGETASLRLEYNHTNYEADLVNNQALVGIVLGF